MAAVLAADDGRGDSRCVRGRNVGPRLGCPRVVIYGVVLLTGHWCCLLFSVHPIEPGGQPHSQSGSGSRRSAPSAPSASALVRALPGGADRTGGADVSAPGAVSAPANRSSACGFSGGADGAAMRVPGT